MSGLFGGGAPRPTPLPPPPNRSSAEIQAAADEQRQKFQGAQGGRALTMLTGGQGVAKGSYKSAAVKLLGDVGG
jgi:hypothetical protein